MPKEKLIRFIFIETTRGDQAVRIPAFQRGGQGFKFNREKINLLVAMEVHPSRLRAMQKCSRPGSNEARILQQGGPIQK